MKRESMWKNVEVMTYERKGGFLPAQATVLLSCPDFTLGHSLFLKSFLFSLFTCWNPLPPKRGTLATPELNFVSVWILGVILDSSKLLAVHFSYGHTFISYCWQIPWGQPQGQGFREKLVRVEPGCPSLVVVMCRASIVLLFSFP